MSGFDGLVDRAGFDISLNLKKNMDKHGHLTYPSWHIINRFWLAILSDWINDHYRLRKFGKGKFFFLRLGLMYV